MTESHMHLTEPALRARVIEILQHLGLDSEHAEANAAVIVAGQRDACASHGVYRLLTIAQTIQSGQVHLQAKPRITAHHGPIVQVDADRGFAPLAFQCGLPALVAAAQSHGMGALVLRHAFHYSALWPEIEAITAHGLIALACCPSHAWVAPAGGHKPVFGTNPLAFGWPRPAGQATFVFDFATSAIARGDLELHRKQGLTLPAGCGVDANGLASTDPVAVAQGAMRTFGGALGEHKGSALATMIELMAACLIGDLTSHASLHYAQDGDATLGSAPYHGELLLAFNPAHFAAEQTSAAQASEPATAAQQMGEQLFAQITDQGARLPSMRRYAARARSAQHGIAIPHALWAEIQTLAPVA